MNSFITSIQLLLLLAITQIKSFTVTLKKQKIEHSQYVFPAYEEVYYTDVLFGNKDQDYKSKTLFDLCSSSNWIITDETQIMKNQATFHGDYQCEKPSCETEQFGSETFSIYGNQAQFTAVQDQKEKNLFYTHKTGYNTIEVQNQEFKKVGFWFPLKQIKAQTGSTPLMNVFKSSLGMGPKLIQYAQNSKDNSKAYLPFHSFIEKQLEKQEKEFSLYFFEDKMEIIFGNHQEYLVKPGHNWTFFQNRRNIQGLQSSTLTNYVLYAPSVRIGDQYQLNLVSQDPYTKNVSKRQNAILDSTSKYIWFGDSALLKQIVNQINLATQSHCTLKNQTVYTCASPVQKFPDLTFTLTDKELLKKSLKNKQESEEFSSIDITLTQEDYLESYKDPQTQEIRAFLLLRPGYYGDQKSLIQKVPSIWFGTCVWKKYYTRFLTESDQIAIVPKYDIPKQGVILSGIFSKWLMGIGALFGLVCIVILLKILRRVPRRRKRGSKSRQKKNKNQQGKEIDLLGCNTNNNNQINMKPMYVSYAYQGNNNQNVISSVSSKIVQSKGGPVRGINMTQNTLNTSEDIQPRKHVFNTGLNTSYQQNTQIQPTGNINNQFVTLF